MTADTASRKIHQPSRSRSSWKLC